jgi:hypothetical protein
VGQRNARRRPERDPDRHHVRHSTVRQRHDGLGEPGHPGWPRRRHSANRCVCRHRGQGARSDVCTAALSDTRLRGRQRRGAGRVDRARWHAVHVSDLAARHLAAAARLRLRRHATVGRHLSCCRSRRAF